MNNTRLDSIDSLWSGAWHLYKAHLDGLLEIFLAPTILLLLGNLCVLVPGPTGAFGRILFTLAGWVFLMLASLSLIHMFHDHSEVHESYRRAFLSFWPFLWLAILSSAVLLGGFFMLIIPGILLAVQFVFMSYVFVIEKKHGLNALLQSRAYAKGYWWAILGRMLLLMLVMIVLSALVGGMLGSLGGRFGAMLAAALFMLFLAPFGIAYHFVLFNNVRTIKPELREDIAAATGGRGFLIASGIVGVVVPILLIAFAVAVLGIMFSRAPHPAPQAPVHFSGVPAEEHGVQ